MRLSLVLAVIALASASAPVPRAAAAPASAAPAQASAQATPAASAPGPGEEMALLVDFVEIGRVDRSVPRGISMVDLLNLSPHVLDVVVGDGSATLQPKERLIARVKSGDQTVTVSTREKGIDPMEGRLHLDDGVRYELALAYGAVPKVTSELAQPGIDSDPATLGDDIAPRPRDLGPAGSPQREPRDAREPRRKGGGKVDVGRRPRR